MFRRLAILLLIVSPTLVLAASKEILELQREVASLQEQIRQMAQAQAVQFAAFNELLKQSVDASKSADRSVDRLQSGIQQSINDQKKEVVAPVVGLSTRMDQVSTDVRQLQQAIADLTASMSKMLTQLGDVNTAIKILQTPPPPPPAPTQGATGTAPQQAAPAQPAMSATDLYNQAQNDRGAGKFELALPEFTDYLKWYGNTDLAPNAQFYIAWIHYSQNQFELAANEFDMVLEKYQENPKTADAHYYKGLSLERSGKRTLSRPEFEAIVRDFPRSETANKACTELKNLGFPCPAAKPPAQSRNGKKKGGE